jgi:hypothetical protein
VTSRPAPAAVNAVVHPVVDYAPDWHGGALFSALTAAAARSLNGPAAVISHHPQWFGWSRQIQSPKGAQAALARGLGGGAPVSPRNSELQKENTTVTDAGTQAIFASRMFRSGGQ